jgi:hypothetical protein
MRVDAKRRGRDEKSDRHSVSQLVVQKATPIRGGHLGHCGRCLPTVAWPASPPSLGSSPGMRATPQSGLVKLARRISRLLIRHTMPHEAHRLR